MIYPSGLIAGITFPDKDGLYEDGSYSGELLIKIIDYPVNAGKFATNKAWDFDTSSFVDLPTKPGSYYNWEGSWVLDTKALIADSKKERNRLLRASDWTQLPDSPMLGNSDWVTYRQSLRDLDYKTDLAQVIWPTEP